MLLINYESSNCRQNNDINKTNLNHNKKQQSLSTIDPISGNGKWSTHFKIGLRLFQNLY